MNNFAVIKTVPSLRPWSVKSVVLRSEERSGRGVGGSGELVGNQNIKSHLNNLSQLGTRCQSLDSPDKIIRLPTTRFCAWELLGWNLQHFMIHCWDISPVYIELLHFTPSCEGFNLIIKTFRHGSVFLFCAAVNLTLFMRRKWSFSSNSVRVGCRKKLTSNFSTLYKIQ